MLELAGDTSNNEVPKLSRYYAIAMNSSANATSAISAGIICNANATKFVFSVSHHRRDCMLPGNHEEYHIVVFLNSPTSVPTVDDENGLRIFSHEYSACLRDHGVAKSPKVHPDFLSTMGSLAVELNEDCDFFYSEVVPRETNRIVVLSPKEAFRFENHLVDSADTESISSIANEFVKSVQLALVYVFA